MVRFTSPANVVSFQAQDGLFRILVDCGLYGDRKENPPIRVSVYESKNGYWPQTDLYNGCWVDLYQDEQFLARVFLQEGEATFGELPPGEYELRLQFNF